MPKRPYKDRGRPEKNRAHLRRQRAYARGGSRPGNKPNPPRRDVDETQAEKPVDAGGE